MFKKYESEVIKRGASRKPLYLVIVREVWSVFGVRLKEGPWKDTGYRTASKVEAAKYALTWRERKK